MVSSLHVRDLGYKLTFFFRSHQNSPKLAMRSTATTGPAMTPALTPLDDEDDELSLHWIVGHWLHVLQSADAADGRSSERLTARSKHTTGRRCNCTSAMVHRTSRSPSCPAGGDTAAHGFSARESRKGGRSPSYFYTTPRSARRGETCSLLVGGRDAVRTLVGRLLL